MYCIESNDHRWLNWTVKQGSFQEAFFDRSYLLLELIFVRIHLRWRDLEKKVKRMKMFRDRLNERGWMDGWTKQCSKRKKKKHIGDENDRIATNMSGSKRVGGVHVKERKRRKRRALSCFKLPSICLHRIAPHIFLIIWQWSEDVCPTGSKGSWLRFSIIIVVIILIRQGVHSGMKGEQSIEEIKADCLQYILIWNCSVEF